MNGKHQKNDLVSRKYSRGQKFLNVFSGTQKILKTVLSLIFWINTVFKLNCGGLYRRGQKNMNTAYAIQNMHKILY